MLMKNIKFQKLAFILTYFFYRSIETKLVTAENVKVTD